MSSELTVEFNQPYSGGVGGGSVGPLPPDRIAIDTRTYLLDTSGNDYRREGVEVLQQRNATSNRDILLLPQNVWRHQSESWHQGAGQRNLDREDALPYRFYRSFGIDPWTKYELTLLNDTSKLLTTAGTDPVFVQVHDGWLTVVQGAQVSWFETPTSTPVFLGLVGTDEAISITYDGDAVITLHDDGKIFMCTDSLTATPKTVTPPVVVAPDTNPPISDATFIAYVKDRLILGVGKDLWDITATQAVRIYRSPVTGFTWKGACEGANAIYLIGGVGDKHVVHRVGIKSDGTGLDAAVVAGTLPDGEIGVSIGSYLGYVFVGTDKGVRMATPTGSAGDLVLGALIPLDKPVYGFEGQDRFVWVTASDVGSTPTGETTGHDEFPASPVCGLYRMDLSTFTVTASTPAYATDLTARDQTGRVVRSVTTWNDKRVFSVDGGGVYLEGTDKIIGGWLEFGRVSFSVEDLKTGLYAQGKWEPLDGTVEMYLAYDGDHPLRIVNWGVQGSVRSGNISMNGQQFSRLDARIDLLRSTANATLGPNFSRFEVRARPVKGAASRWYLPIINHESLDLNGIIENRDVNVEFDTLMNLVETGVMFTLQEAGRAYQAVAVDFKWLPQKLTSTGSGWQGVYLLIAEEVK
jgi:hypothetical protein